MNIIKHIKEKGNAIIKELKELSKEDLFAVSIDDSDERMVCDAKSKLVISPGDDDGYEDEQEGIMSN